MAVFTSAYRQLAHGALNWDTQLGADMTTLETILQQGTWTPGFGGTAASLGTGGTTNGYATRLGQHITYNGRFAFGSSPAWGTGTPAVTGVNYAGNIDTTTAVGTGFWTRPGGALVPLVLVPLSASSFAIYAIQSGALVLPGAVAALSQSDTVVVTASVVLA